jgi:hypothetical protein
MGRLGAAVQNNYVEWFSNLRFYLCPRFLFRSMNSTFDGGQSREV